MSVAKVGCGATLALFLVLMLAGCSRTSFFSLDNRSGQAVVIEYLDGSIWRKQESAPADKVTERIPLGLRQRLRAGDCTYTYDSGVNDIAAAQPRIEDGGWGPPYVTHLLRLDADFALRLFNAKEDGRLGEEVISTAWPAKPTVECRSKG